jgi:hypothetical protein
MPTVSANTRRKIERLAREGKSSRQIAKLVGHHDTTVLRYMPEDAKRSRVEAKPAQTVTDDMSKDSRVISMPKTRIHTLDELLKFCEVDRDVWDVERYVCNKWEVGAADKRDGKLRGIIVEPLYQIKVWLKKKVEVQRLKDEVERFKAEAARCAPKFPHIVRMRSQYSSGVWVEPSLYDHHFGALIWAKETGQDDYDCAIAKRCWGQALSSLLDRTASFKPEGALFVIGNDQQNADNRAGTTEKGTSQSMDTRYEKVYSISRDATKWAIDQMLARGLRVHVPVVRGNHDPLAAWHLGEELAAWYRNNPRVTIDNAPTMRKWWEHGVNMLMLLHGNAGKLEDYGKTMAAEQPAMWGRTHWRETHSGDKHQRRLIEQPGCTVRILPSLRPPCAWSAENMYQSIRAAEAFVWSKTEALIGGATYSILPGQMSGSGK